MALLNCKLLPLRAEKSRTSQKIHNFLISLQGNQYKVSLPATFNAKTGFSCV